MQQTQQSIKGWKEENEEHDPNGLCKIGQGKLWIIELPFAKIKNGAFISVISEEE